MTLAARELHLTQSGISQHIKTLEDTLGFPLFDRVQKRLLPTSHAHSLYGTTSESLDKIESTLSELRGEKNMLRGLVRIGVPSEFGINVVLPHLAEFGTKNPGVDVRVTTEFSSEVIDQILLGEIDFGFIDEFQSHKRVFAERVWDEVLELCVHKDLLKKWGTPQNSYSYFEKLEYVDYGPGEQVIRAWVKHHFGERNATLRTRATIREAQGVARLILKKLGAGVLPDHLVSKLIADGEPLVRLAGSGKPLKNAISIAFLQEKTQSPAVQALIPFLQKSLRL